MTKRVTGHHDKAVEKERGGWLTAALVLIIIRNAVVAIWIFTLGRNDDVTTSTLMTILLVMVALTDVISGIAMWYWKKWGLRVKILRLHIAVRDVIYARRQAIMDGPVFLNFCP